MKIGEVMKSVKTVDGDISLAKASEIMNSENIGSLVIVKDKKIKGLITHKDIVKNFGKNVKVSKIMTTEIVSISSEENVNEAIEIMKGKKISVLPVIDSSGLVGIISADDIAIDACEGEDFLID
jgi:CBS domain-containing protein